MQVAICVGTNARHYWATARYDFSSLHLSVVIFLGYPGRDPTTRVGLPGDNKTMYGRRSLQAGTVAMR